MANAVEVANMALGNIGVSRSIESLSEESEDAKQCLRWFNQVRDECLRKTHWQFALGYAQLVALPESPTAEYGYAYAQPVDCLKMIAVGPENMVTRFVEGVARAPFRLVAGASTKAVILTDMAGAWCAYIRRVEEAPWWPSEFANYVAWALAVRIGPALGADRSTQQTAAAEMRNAFRDAVVSIQNERHQDQAPTPDVIDVRW